MEMKEDFNLHLIWQGECHCRIYLMFYTALTSYYKEEIISLLSKAYELIWKKN